MTQGIAQMEVPVVPELEGKKCVLVIDADLPLGLLANTAAVLSLTIGSRFSIVGRDLQDGSGSKHSGLTTIPVPILRSEAGALSGLRDRAQVFPDVFTVDVTDAAQTTTNYVDYEAKLLEGTSASLRYLGIALFGSKKSINKLTGGLPLLR